MTSRTAPKALIADQAGEREDARTKGTNALRLVGLAIVVAIPPLWLLSLRDVDPRQMTDVGLVSVLPLATYALIAVLTMSFVALLAARPLSQGVVLLHVVVLAVLLYGTTSVIEEIPRFAATWRHLGITDYIMRTGQVNPNIDAYFNWPGFFVLLAFLTKNAGLGSAVVFAKWTPVFFSLLYVAPLIVIFRRATADGRVVWLAIWVFLCANWVGQDYLSPQGLSYFLYLAVLALLVRFFVNLEPGGSLRTRLRLRRNARPHQNVGPVPDPKPNLLDRMEAYVHLERPAERPAGSITPSPRPAPPETLESPLQRVGVMAAIIIVSAAMVPAHQLTPFALLAVLAALAVLGLSTARRLPVILAVLIPAWMLFMASSYLAGHFGGLASEVGDVGGAVGSSLGARVGGSPGHVAVVIGRLALTSVLWLLATAGAVRGRPRSTASLAVLGLAPFSLLVIQSYGGEILLRIYLFTLPAAAFFAAAFLVRLIDTRTVRSALAFSSALVFLLAGFLVARYGNERADLFTHSELNAVDSVYSWAQPDSVIVAGSENMPWKFKKYEEYDLEKITDLTTWSKLAGSRDSMNRLMNQIDRLMRRPNSSSAFLIFMDSQVAEADLFGSAPRGSLARVWEAVALSPRFRAVYSSSDAAVFVPVRRDAAR